MIFIVVPAYNEEKNIGRVVSGLFEQGYSQVVVVDDGSTDNTEAVARQAGAHVVKHVLNRGQGAALQTGNEYAALQGAQVIVHFDGDGQFNPSDIAVALSLMKSQQVDLVLGSRFLDERSHIPFTKKYIIFPLGRLINTLLTGVTLTDVHNGFRVLSRKAAENIVITQDRMAHNSEIVSYIKKNKLRYTECPVEVFYLRYGQGIKGGITILKDWFLAMFSKIL